MSTTKTFLVIGGNTGVGLESIKSLCAQNHQVISFLRTPSSELEALGVEQHVWDVTNRDQFPHSELPEQLHGCVYCPGTIQLKPFHRISMEDFQKEWEVNVLGAVHVIQKILPLLKKADHSSIVFFSSVAAQLGMGFHSSISMAKSALEGLTRSLAAELCSYHIRVNAIALSLTRTALAEKLIATPEKEAQVAKRHPLNKIGEPQHVAELVNFLLSDSSEWVTGQVLSMDGGMSAIRNF